MMAALVLAPTTQAYAELQAAYVHYIEGGSFCA